MPDVFEHVLAQCLWRKSIGRFFWEGFWFLSDVFVFFVKFFCLEVIEFCDFCVFFSSKGFFRQVS